MATTSDSRNPTDCCGFRRQSAKKIHTPVNLFDSSWHLFYFYKESMKRHNHQMPPFCVWVQSPVPTCSVTITSTDLLLVDAMSQSPTQTCCLCVLCHIHQYIPAACVCSVTFTNIYLLLVCALSHSPMYTCCLCVLCHIHQYIPAACVCSVTVTNTELLLVCALSHSPIQNCCLCVLCHSHQYRTAACVCSVTFTNTDLLRVGALPVRK